MWRLDEISILLMGFVLWKFLILFEVGVEFGIFLIMEEVYIVRLMVFLFFGDIFFRGEKLFIELLFLYGLEFEFLIGFRILV